MSGLISATNMIGFDYSRIDMSAFTDTGFDLSWNNGILLLSYSSGGDPNAVPEPTTLVVLGLGLADLGLAGRRRK